MTERLYCVYVHTSPDGKRYVGATKKIPTQRWRKGEGYRKHHARFYESIQKYGWDKFTHEIVATNLSKEEAERKEVELIALYKSDHRDFGYNITSGGVSGWTHAEDTKAKISKRLSGHTVSEETREKIRAALTGRRGKPLSPEHRERLRAINLGKKASDETKKRLSASHIGKKLSPETRAKMSQSRKGVSHPTEWVAVAQYDGETQIATFRSITEAEHITGVCRTNISSVAKGKRAKAGGYRWEYISGGEEHH